MRRLDPDPVATFDVRPGRFVREVEARGTLKAVTATPIVAPIQSRRAQKVAFLAQDGSLLKKGDLVVEFDPYDAQREAADSQADLAAAKAKIDKAKAEGSKNQRSIAIDRDVARGDLSRAEQFKLTDETLYSRNQIIESRLSRELAATQLDVSGKRLAASSTLSAAERALGEIDTAKANLKLDRARQSLGALRVSAPHDGLLVLARNWRGETTFVGDTLWPGQKVGELPDLSQLEAKVFVLEADGAGLRPGLLARVVDRGATGRGAQGQAWPASSRSPRRPAGNRRCATSRRRLSLARTDPAIMKPGQRVRATLRLEEAEGVLAVPRGAVFDRDGRRVVYKRRGAAFVPAEVTIGRQSVSRVVIDKGLAAGDVVALRDPTAKRAGAAEETRVAGPGR